MKLNEKDLITLKDLIRFTSSLNMDAIAIDSSGARSIMQESGIVMFSKFSGGEFKDLPTFATSRIQVLNSRLKLFEKDFEVVVTDKEKSDGTKFISSLNIKKGRTVISFNGNDPTLLRIPKRVNDTLAFKYYMNKYTFDLILKSKSAMTTDLINVSLSKETGKIMMRVIEKDGADEMVHYITDNFEQLGDKTSFSHTFKYNVLSAILKDHFANNDSLDIYVTARNTLYCNPLDLDLYVFPEV
jgi:hypothetical protein